MVTLLKNNFEGQSAGTATVGNSGDSGAAFSHLVASGGTTFAYANLSGNMVLAITPGTGQGYPRWTTTGADGRRAVLRRSFYVDPAKYAAPTPPTAVWPLLDIRTEVDATAALASIHMRAGFFQLQARVGNATDLTESRWNLPSGGWFVLELAVTVSSGTDVADGKVEYRVYAADGTTLLHTWSSGNTLVTNPSPPNIARFSGNTSTSGVTPEYLDDLQALFTDNLAAWLGPYSDTRALTAPELTLMEVTRPTTEGGSDGSITVSWPRINDAEIDYYEVGVAVGHNATTGFITKGTVPQPPSGPTITATLTGLVAGAYTVGVRSMPDS